MLDIKVLPSPLIDRLDEYISTGRSSPYNQRRSQLRALVDLMYDQTNELEKALLDGRVAEIDPAHAKKGLKPTFNSFRGLLSPSVLEEMVFCAIEKIINTKLSFTKFGDSLLWWVDQSIKDIDDHVGGKWGSVEDRVEVDSRIDGVMDALEVWKSKGLHVLAKPPASKSSKLLTMPVLTSSEYLKIESKEGKKMSGEVKIEELTIVLEPAHKEAVDVFLNLNGMGTVDAINDRIIEMDNKTDEFIKENKILAERLASAISKPAPPTTVAASVSGELPDGEVVMKLASEVFSSASHLSDKLFNFDVPTFEWKGVHPDVPSVDENYQFDGKALFRVLQGIVDGNNSYLYGHTGTGKSTLVEQVCAHLKFPLVRVNFDSEISRMDLIGRDTLVTVDGQTVSKFVEGVLPDALSRPCLLLCDEVDFVRPDVMYVFQRVLEGNGLLISEDGGRKVTANPWFRLIATANTVGQGDDTAMYQGARPQSMATLDRFENWVEMGYMKSKVEKTWLRGVTDGLTDDDAKMFIKYAKEHREAFVGGQIMQPLSPRGLRAMAKRFVTLLGLTGDTKESQTEAFEATVLARCTQQDKTVLEGLYQRVIG